MAPNYGLFVPQCTHTTMTRVYCDDFICGVCRRPGSWGWLYRCTQDREVLIEAYHAEGREIAFDPLGKVLTSGLNTRKHSAKARQDKLALLTELTPSSLPTYTPEQLHLLLCQRANVQDVIAKQRQVRNPAFLFPRRAVAGPSSASDATAHSPTPSSYGTWVPRDDEECQYKVCGYCRGSCAHKAFLSLNAVADGEVPPTAATGYGFHLMGDRPVLDASVVKNLGLRPNPEGLFLSMTGSDISTASLNSLDTVGDIISGRFPQGTGFWSDHRANHEAENGDDITDEYWALPQRADATGPQLGNLKRSPGSQNLVEHINGLLADDSGAASGISSMLRPKKADESLTDKCCSVGPERWPNMTGRANSRSLDDPAIQKALLGASNLIVARRTPLPPTSPDEDAFFAQPPSAAMMELEIATGNFSPEPLRVTKGVAVTEKSVELTAADIVTQC